MEEKYETKFDAWSIGNNGQVTKNPDEPQNLLHDGYQKYLKRKLR
jgi:hypothetical protein